MTRPLRAARPRLCKGALLPSRPVTADLRYYGSFRPCASIVERRSLQLRYFRPRGFSTCAFPFQIETTGSKVPYLSLIHARAALRPDAMPVPNRTWPALLPGPKRYPGFDVLFPPFDPSSTVHFRSPSWTISDAVLPRLLNWTFTTATLNHRSSSRFAVCPCRPTARGLLSSQTQLSLHTAARRVSAGVYRFKLQPAGVAFGFAEYRAWGFPGGITPTPPAAIRRSPPLLVAA